MIIEVTLTAAEDRALDKAGYLLAEAKSVYLTWRTVLAAGDKDLAFQLRGFAIAKLQEAMGLTQSTIPSEDWRGWCTSQRSYQMEQRISPYVQTLARSEWEDLESARLMSPASSPPASDLLFTCLTEAPLVSRADLRLGDSIADVSSTLGLGSSVPKTELKDPLDDQGVIARFRNDRLAGIDFLFRAESIPGYWGAPFSGDLWGIVGAGATRSDLISWFGWPTEVLKSSQEATPHALVYVRDDCRIVFVFEVGLYATLSHVSVERSGLERRGDESRVMVSDCGRRHPVFRAW